MHHPGNILNNLVSFFTWKRIRHLLLDSHLVEQVEYKKISLITKKPHIRSRNKARSPQVPRSPIIKLELRKSHPFFVEYHFKSFVTEVNNYGKKKSH
jgi:hypothetical protein